ncbi:phage tail fiber protein [Proteus terrae]|uniref:phage tail fiber protein n=1 Tax=Proteus terrae TaxID=1574161 RepID=UPI003524B6F1
MIYTTGTVNTVSGSAIVKGTGTIFKNNNPAINIGMTILIKSGNANIPYMIKSVNSDTELVLAQPALATATNTTFSIHITEPDNNSDAARTMVAINSYVEYFLDAMNTWMTETGQTKIEMPNGEIVTLDSIKKMQGDISKKADDNKTVHVGDFGVGATADNGPIIPLTPPDANDITSAGFYGAGGANSANYFEPYKPLIVSTRQGGDGTGAVLQIQSGGTVQAPLLANRIRVNAKAWSDWSVLASLTNSETQRFNGQLMSYQGLYSSDKSNPTNYFGLLRAEKGVPYGFYLSYDGSGYSIRFPEKIGGTILIDKTPPTVSKKDINKNGFYQCQDIEPYNVMFMGIACTHISNDAYVFSLWGRGNRFLFSTKDNGAWLGTWEVWTTANARADTNGFIKKASPIIDINPDGTFTTNDESEGATVTRIAQGEYLIEGVLGFNADAGWGGVDGGIEIPLDVNKQPLIWVNSEVSEDGSILVKTYHRTHPNAPEFANNDIDGFNDGDPIDIPDGRFISVRVQMPEQSIYNVRMREMEEAQKAERHYYCGVKINE